MAEAKGRLRFYVYCPFEFNENQKIGLVGEPKSGLGLGWHKPIQMLKKSSIFWEVELSFEETAHVNENVEYKYVLYKAKKKRNEWVWEDDQQSQRNRSFRLTTYGQRQTFDIFKKDPSFFQAMGSAVKWLLGFGGATDKIERQFLHFLLSTNDLISPKPSQEEHSKLMNGEFLKWCTKVNCAEQLIKTRKFDAADFQAFFSEVQVSSSPVALFICYVLGKSNLKEIDALKAFDVLSFLARFSPQDWKDLLIGFSSLQTLKDPMKNGFLIAYLSAAIANPCIIFSVFPILDGGFFSLPQEIKPQKNWDSNQFCKEVEKLCTANPNLSEKNCQIVMKHASNLSALLFSFRLFPKSNTLLHFFKTRLQDHLQPESLSSWCEALQQGDIKDILLPVMQDVFNKNMGKILAKETELAPLFRFLSFFPEENFTIGEIKKIAQNLPKQDNQSFQLQFYQQCLQRVDMRKNKIQSMKDLEPELVKNMLKFVLQYS